MADSGRVSVLIPFRNAEATLEAAVESLVSQTFRDWELLLVDDGSSDGGGRLSDRTAERDPRIRTVHTPPLGIVAALNRGIAEARGEVLARMDADDVCHPERLERQMALLRARPEVDVAACRVAFGGDRETRAGYAAHVDWQNGLLTHEELHAHRFVDAPVAHPSVMFRRAALDRFGGYRDGAFPEDFELWLRWFEAGARFVKLPEVLLTWNDSPRRLSRVAPRYHSDAFYRVKCEYLARAVPAESRPPWLWGAGRVTRKRFRALEERGCRFAGFVDIDPAKIGQRLQGRPVVAPEALPEDAFVLLGVANPGARRKAARFLESRGRRIGRDFLPAA